MKWIAMVGMLGLLIGSVALAQDHPEHPKSSAKTGALADVVEATVTGENTCLGCMLEEERGAGAQCKTYGHRHGLKVTAATTEGKDVPELVGWFLHYLETDQAQAFIKEHHAETLVLRGKIYTDARVLEVDAQEKATKPEDDGSEHPEHPEHPK